MNKTFVKGAAILTITTFLSKLLGSFFQIPLQNIAGDEVLGIFRLVFPVLFLEYLLVESGIPEVIYLGAAGGEQAERCGDGQDGLENETVIHGVLH